MSSNTELTSEEKKMLAEELGESKETTNEKKDDVKLELSEEELPEKKSNENPYLNLLTDTYTENQKEQNERAEQVVRTQEFKLKRVDGQEEELKYKMLNRKEDVEVRAAQRKYFKIKTLGDKLRASYLPPKIEDKNGNEIDNKDYKPFNINEFLVSPFLKGKIDADMSREEVDEILAEVTDEQHQERFTIFARCFFDLDTDEKIDQYIYKELTFILDCAYSFYTTVPY